MLLPGRLPSLERLPDAVGLGRPFLACAAPRRGWPQPPLPRLCSSTVRSCSSPSRFPRAVRTFCPSLRCTAPQPDWPRLPLSPPAGRTRGKRRGLGSPVLRPDPTRRWPNLGHLCLATPLPSSSSRLRRAPPHLPAAAASSELAARLLDACMGMWPGGMRARGRPGF